MDGQALSEVRIRQVWRPKLRPVGSYRNGAGYAIGMDGFV